MYREAMKHQGKRGDFDDNVIEVGRSPVGNTRAYTLSRFKRQRQLGFDYRSARRILGKDGKRPPWWTRLDRHEQLTLWDEHA